MLKTCDINNFDLAFKILKQSFPLTERRDYKGQKNILSCENYKLLALFNEDESQILGIAGVWVLDGVVFIEHLAVDKKHRNKGIGSKILSLIARQFNSLICLEVEPAESELQQKRIDFYLKNNFYFNNYYYVQPSYGKRYPEIRLYVMSYGKELNDSEFRLVASEIYAKVYKKTPTFLGDNSL